MLKLTKLNLGRILGSKQYFSFFGLKFCFFGPLVSVYRTTSSLMFAYFWGSALKDKIVESKISQLGPLKICERGNPHIGMQILALKCS